MKRSFGRLWAVAGLALLLGMALGAQPLAAALAAPSEPTLTLKQLSDLLDANGPSYTVDGYFKTVVHDSTIKNIPVTIKSVLPTWTAGFPYPMIFIQATGPDIADAGGSIAAGMSGSPVFVDDGTGDKLIGAVSYGEMAGTNGYGYATPIEAMSGQEAGHPASPPKMPAVVQRGGKKFQLLRAFSITGLKPGSRAFKAMTRKLAGRGIKVLPSGGMLRASDPGFSTTFDGGSSLGAFISRGDFMAGGLGTVTYSSPTTLVAFGHPFDWDGDTELYLTNAWVHGIFAIDPGSWDSPFKMMSPTALRGVVTQDREFGIEARYGAAGSPVMPTEEAPITSQVTIPSTGQQFSALTYMPTRIIDMPWFSDFAAFAVDSMYDKVPIDANIPQGAITTSTVVMTDGTNTYTVRLRNVQQGVWSDSYDLFAVLDGFTAVTDWGLQPVHFKSVDLQTRAETVPVANIVDVSVPGGLKVGDNTIKVDTLMYGVADTQTAYVPLKIPAGTPLAGEFDVSAPDGRVPWFFTDTGMPSSGSNQRKTVAQVIDEIEAMPANNDLQVSFTPYGGSSFFAPRREAAATKAASTVAPSDVETSAPTSWYLVAGASKTSPRLTIRANRRTVSYGGYVMLSGSLTDPVSDGLSDDTTVTLFARAAGASTDTTLAQLPISPGSDEGPFFSDLAFGLRKNTTFTVKWTGDDDYLDAAASAAVKVAPRVTLTTSARSLAAGRTVRLNAKVLPAQTGASVAFERQTRGVWRRLKTVALAAGGIARFNWKPSRGTQLVRAHFLGSTLNPAGASATKTIIVL